MRRACKTCPWRKMTATPCPYCKGRCCRDYLGYKPTHMNDEFYRHVCDHCEDGTHGTPSPYDPKTDPYVRDACVALGVYVNTLLPGYDPLTVAAQVERRAMEIAERAVRAALKTHDIKED